MTGAVFVTGGSGFVGGAILRRLLAEGRTVRALARSDGSRARIADLGATPVHADLFDPTSLARAMRGCSIVFHIAGVNEMCPRDPARMRRVNVEGASSTMRAAAAAGAARFVHTSSAATIGEASGAVGREDTRHRGSFLSCYERSKHEAEKRVLEEGAALGIEVVCVNPSSVQGPGRTGGTARLLMRVADARLVVLVRTWLSVVDVDDCAEGHVLAATRAVPGERYILSGASLRLERAVTLLRAANGRPRHVVWLPRAVARAASPVSAVAARLADDPLLCPAMIRTLLHGHRYDGSRAERELGVRYTPIERTLDRTLAWYRERKLLGPP
jgi:dihydroflavonol-4-reductase